MEGGAEDRDAQQCRGSQTRTTTYEYSRVWSDRPIDSSRFRRRDGHENPAMPVTGRSQTAPNATLGAFRAESRVVGLFGSGSEQKLEVTDAQLTAFQRRLGAQARLNDGGIYVGYDAANPVIGDIRITYAVLPEGPATVVARQVGQGFGPYQASNGREVFPRRDGGEKRAGTLPATRTRPTTSSPGSSGSSRSLSCGSAST